HEAHYAAEDSPFIGDDDLRGRGRTGRCRESAPGGRAYAGRGQESGQQGGRLTTDPRPDLKPLHPVLYESAVRSALLEDLGRAGDLTTDAIVARDAQATAWIVARAAGRIAGREVALCGFPVLDTRVRSRSEERRVGKEGRSRGCGEV